MGRFEIGGDVLRVFKEKFMEIIFLVCACLSIVAIFMICAFIFFNAVPALNEIGWIDFVFGKVWKPRQDLFGVFPMIIASLYVTAGAVLIGVPVGVLTAVFMAFYCPKFLYKIIKPMINLLASIPSIVYGFFFLVVIVPFFQQITDTSGKGILTVSVLLGLMILPTIVNVAETALRAVPSQYFDGALALGATKERAVFRIVIPGAKSGILSSVILGIGRAIGETMAVVMVAGNQAVFPTSITSGVRTLTSNIVLEMGYASGIHRGALIGTAALLFIFILIINFCFSLLVKIGEDKM